MEIYTKTVQTDENADFFIEQNGPRISGYGRFASAKRKFSIFGAARRFRPFSGATGGGNFHVFACIPDPSASLLVIGQTVCKNLNSMSSPRPSIWFGIFHDMQDFSEAVGSLCEE